MTVDWQETLNAALHKINKIQQLRTDIEAHTAELHQLMERLDTETTGDPPDNGWQGPGDLRVRGRWYWCERRRNGIPEAQFVNYPNLSEWDHANPALFLDDPNEIERLGGKP